MKEWGSGRAGTRRPSEAGADWNDSAAAAAGSTGRVATNISISIIIIIINSNIIVIKSLGGPRRRQARSRGRALQRPPAAKQALSCSVRRSNARLKADLYLSCADAEGREPAASDGVFDAAALARGPSTPPGGPPLPGGCGSRGREG